MEPLRVGMAGEHVRTLQAALVAVGIVAGQPTGQFDPTTQRAVIEVQRRAGLAQTGIVDEQTWNALYQMQSSVQPGADPASVQVDQPAAPPMGNGIAVLAAIGIGLATYWAHTKAKGEYGDEEEDEGDDEGYEEDDGEDVDDSDFRPVGRARMSDLDDAVTDSLIDEPAVIASSRRPGDCKKAARMLLSRSGLAQRPGEKALYNKVVRRVASDCHDHQDVVKEAIDEVQDRQEEIEDMLDARSVLETETYETNEGTRSRRFVEPGFRKTKRKWTNKSTSARKKRRSEISPGEKDLLDTIAHSKRPNRPGASGGGRPGASAIRVKKRGGDSYRIRKEKAKTKTGHTWRKVKD